MKSFQMKITGWNPGLPIRDCEIVLLQDKREVLFCYVSITVSNTR